MPIHPLFRRVWAHLSATSKAIASKFRRPGSIVPDPALPSLLMLGIALLLTVVAALAFPMRNALPRAYSMSIQDSTRGALVRKVVTVRHESTSWPIELRLWTDQRPSPPSGPENRVWLRITGGVALVDHCKLVPDLAASDSSSCEYSNDDAFGASILLTPQWSKSEKCPRQSPSDNSPCFEALVTASVVSKSSDLLVATNGALVRAILPSVSLKDQDEVVVHMPIDSGFLLDTGPVPSTGNDGPYTTWWLKGEDLAHPVGISGSNSSVLSNDALRTFIAGLLAGVAGSAFIAAFQMLPPRRRPSKRPT